MSQIDTVLKLVEKVFDLEVENKQLKDSIYNLQKMVNDEQEKAKMTITSLNGHYVEEHEKRKRVEERLAFVEAELKRTEQGLSGFGIHKNDIGFWQDKDYNRD
jgi:multidrug resistance efflux pump